jgi:hypothetical protein
MTPSAPGYRQSISTTGQVAALMRADMARYIKIIKAATIKLG